MAAENGKKLTKKVVDQADLSRGRHVLWDVELKGFGLQVEPTGTKTYIVRYRPKGLGRSGSRRFVKIGRHGAITAEQARASAKAILGRVAQGADPAVEAIRQRETHEREASAVTIRQLGEVFLEQHVRNHRKSSTAISYEILLRRHIVPEFGDRPAARLSREDVIRLHAAMGGQRPNANRMLAFISSMYGFAAKRGLIADGLNPARGVEKYREEGRERYLTADEQRRLGASLVEAESVGIPWEIDDTNPKAKHTPKKFNGQRQLVDPYAVAAIRLLLFTGARLREILHLRWRFVDFERGILLLPDSKTGKKTIVLNTVAIEILSGLAARSGRDNVGLHGATGDVVIRGATSDKPRADLKRPWEAIRRHAQLEGVRLHDLRHTFASVGAGASLGLPIVGRLLGHAQPQTTARYAHLDADPLRRAANVIGEQIATALGHRGLERGTKDQ